MTDRPRGGVVKAGCTCGHVVSAVTPVAALVALGDHAQAAHPGPWQVVLQRADDELRGIHSHGIHIYAEG